MDRSSLRRRIVPFAASVLATVLVGCAPVAPPTDAELSARFSGLRGTLDELVAVDTALARSSRSYADSAFLRLNDRRHALLARAGLLGGENISGSEIQLPIWREAGEEKGFAHCTHAPENQVSSLDVRRKLGRHPAQVVRYHRHLDGPWYLYRGTSMDS